MHVAGSHRKGLLMAARTRALPVLGSIGSAAIPVEPETRRPQMSNTQHLGAKCKRCSPLYMPSCYVFPADLESALTSKLISYRQD